MSKILTAWICALLFAATAQAEGDRSKAKMKSKNKQQQVEDERRSYMVKELNLSNDQVDKIQAVKNKYRSELAKLEKEKWKLKKELWEMSREPKKGAGHQSELTAKHEQMQKARDAYDDKKFQMMLEARAVLNPEQIASLDDVMKRKWGYHKWKHKRRSKQAQESPPKK